MAAPVVGAAQVAAGAPGKAAAAAHSSMRAFGPVIRQPALGRHTGSVIMLHGLGDTGDGGCGSMPGILYPSLVPVLRVVTVGKCASGSGPASKCQVLDIRVLLSYSQVLFRHFAISRCRK